MKIIKNILRRLNPALAPAGAKKMPEMARERPSTGIPEADNCGNCYVCQAGIIPSITVDRYREIVKDGRPVPDEWLVNDCIRCYSCQSCYTEQGGE